MHTVAEKIPASPASARVSAPDLRRADVQERLLLAAFAVDALIIAGALLAAFWIRFESPLSAVGEKDASIQLVDYLGHMALGGALLLVSLVNYRLYDVRTLLSYRNVARILTRTCGLWFIAYTAVTLVLKFNPPISRVYCALAFALVYAGLLLWRRAFFLYVRRERISRVLRQRVIFVGWCKDCARLSAAIRLDANHPFEVVGALPAPDGWGEDGPPKDVPVIGSGDMVRDILASQRIDVVMVGDMNLRRRDMLALSAACEKEMVDFKIVPSCFQILLSGLHLESMSGVPVLGVSKLPLHSAFNLYVKRIVDVAGGVVGLILSIPLVAVFGTLVYLESPGPIFYRQRRLGRNGKLFDIIKIRSMRLDAEQDARPGWTQKGDPRCLRVGRLMRAWNIDEVPQFWNVIKGEMSLVGPRPERPELILDFREEIPHYNARHNIKPGLTGWAQINGYRGDTDLTERIKCDLYYIENWNLMLDIQIMFLTFFRRQNAC